jgi:hypothetical protein
VDKSRKSAREAFAAAVEKPGGWAIWFARSFAVLASPFAHWVAIARSPKSENAERRIKTTRVLFRVRFWRLIECNHLLQRREGWAGAIISPTR